MTSDPIVHEPVTRYNPWVFWALNTITDIALTIAVPIYTCWRWTRENIKLSRNSEEHRNDL